MLGLRKQFSSPATKGNCGNKTSPKSLRDAKSQFSPIVGIFFSRASFTSNYLALNRLIAVSTIGKNKWIHAYLGKVEKLRQMIIFIRYFSNEELQLL